MSFVGDLRAVLREPGFPRLYATRLASQASDGCFQVALAGFVFFNPDRATDARSAAAAFAVLLLPYSVVGPFAGVFLDRWRRQRVLAVGNLVRAALVLGVAALIGAGVGGAAFFLTALVALSVNRFYLAGLSAALPRVVTRRELVMANSVSTTSGTVVAALGGGLGYLVSRVLGGGSPADAAVAGIAAVGYLGSAAVAAGFAADRLGPEQGVTRLQLRDALAGVLAGLADGARHVWSHRRAGHALGAITAHRFCYGLSTIATVLLYRNYFHSSADTGAGLSGLALVVAASAAGFLTAAVVTPTVTTRLSKESWITVLFAGAAVVEVAFGAPYRQWSFLVAAYALGVAAQGAKICVDTLVQEAVVDAYRGRVFAFYDVVFNVAFVAAAAVGALLLPMSGKSYPALALIAGGYAATALAYRWASGRRWAGLDDAERAGELAPAGGRSGG